MISLTQLVRAQHGRLVASLARTTYGDLQLAEDALQEAVVAALVQWGEHPPERPEAWLLRTAKHKAIDAMRRQGTWRRKAERIRQESTEFTEPPELEEGIVDERLRLMCTCCHPALGLEARVALTLKVVAGLTSDELARAFLVDRTTMQQRLVRAKKKIKVAGIPYEVPGPEVLPTRMGAIRHVIYLVFTEGWAATSGDALVRGELCDEALRLAQVLAELHSDDGETHGLLSLMWLTDARRATRCDADGVPVLLEDQDRGQWDRRAVALGMAALGAAVRRGPPGPYTLQAAIASVHARAEEASDTDWAEIVSLYDLLAQAAPSPVIQLNRAAAVGMSEGPDAGLAALEPLADHVRLQRGHLLFSARAAFLKKLGRREEAIAAYQQALQRVTNPAERRWLQGVVDELVGSVGDA